MDGQTDRAREGEKGVEMNAYTYIPQKTFLPVLSTTNPRKGDAAAEMINTILQHKTL